MDRLRGASVLFAFLVSACGMLISSDGEDAALPGRPVEDADAAVEGGTTNEVPPFCPVPGVEYCTSFDGPSPLEGFTQEGSGGTSSAVTDTFVTPPASIMIQNGTAAIALRRDTSVASAIAQAKIRIAALPTEPVRVLRLMANDAASYDAGVAARVQPDGTVELEETCFHGACAVGTNVAPVAGFVWPLQEWVEIVVSTELPEQTTPRVAKLDVTAPGSSKTVTLSLRLAANVLSGGFNATAHTLALGNHQRTSPSGSIAWRIWVDDVALTARTGD